MGQNDKTSRRDFLGKTALGAVALSVAPSVGRYAFGVEGAAAQPGEGLKVGVIGVGGRGQGLLRESKMCGAHIAAVADVYEARLNQVKEAAPDASIHYDYRELLDRPDIDAVVVATPDHWHCKIVEDACEAGKDIYCEKPMSHTIEEGRRMVKAVRKHGRVLQVGNQFRSSPAWQKVADIVQSGKLGKIHWIRTWDTRDWTRGDPFSPPRSGIHGRLDWDVFQGKARKREMDPWRYFAWRWYWDYAGGLLTDIGAHRIGLIHWIMDVKGPVSATANGGKYYFPHWETPDVVEGVWDYGTFCAAFTVQFLNDQEGEGLAVYGNDATLFVGPGKNQLLDSHGNVLEEWPRDDSPIHHVGNWLDCVKTRKDPNSNVEYANQVINACHLANMSYRQGKRMYWDAEKERALDRAPRKTT